MRLLILFFAAIFSFSSLLAQKKIPLTTSNLQIINRTAKDTIGANGSYVKFEDEKGEGLAWITTHDKKKGEITVYMRGKDVLQRSFIGLAFNAIDEHNYEAVYCRPFNFYAKDSVRRIHAIQYIAHPEFTWKTLRDNRNAIFEKEIINAPNPNDWFKMRLVINKKQVKAFINDEKKPSLKVDRLSQGTIGKIGLFMGDGAGGDFQYITVR